MFDFKPICGPFEAVLASFWWPQHPYGDPGTCRDPRKGIEVKTVYQKHGPRVRHGGAFESLFWMIFQLDFAILFGIEFFRLWAALGPKSMFKGARKGANMDQKVTPDRFCAMC